MFFLKFYFFCFSSIRLILSCLIIHIDLSVIFFYCLFFLSIYLFIIIIILILFKL